MPPTPLSKELPSLSASTIDTLLSFPRKLPIPFPRELPVASPRELPIAFPRELPIAFQREPPLTPELPAISPGKLPAQYWYIPSLPEKPQVPTRKPPALVREAPKKETALVDHKKIANLKISHIESTDKLQVSHKGVFKVNRKGVLLGIPPVLFIRVLKVNIKGVPKEIPTVPTGAC
jgi:hypothetical protein